MKQIVSQSTVPPSKRKIDEKKYDITVDAPFELDQDVPFNFLCETFNAVDECQGANSKVDTLQRY